jgi:HlyD family secretion protein
MKIIASAITLILLINVIGCSGSKSSAHHQKQSYTVKRESVHKALYFTGTIAPLRESAITSPMDSVIETMNYRYGQKVNKGDVIVTLNSNELQRQYNEILTEYLKAKDSFTVARAKFTGTQNLWDAGLLSKNNFLSEKSSLDTARVTLIQATRKLTEMLEKMDDVDEENLSKLSIAEFDKVRQALTGKHNLIHLKSPANGVLLYPPKSSDDKTGHLTAGSTVKAGQVFALVGDLSGIRVEIDVPEIDIDKIHPGMKAIITGVALGKQQIKGELIAVNAQASAASGNALPSFSAVVEVKALTASQRPWIKVGMSAAIELVVDDDAQLFIPIAAIRQEHGASVVTVRAPDGVESTRKIVTGAAEANKVVIDSGLKEGDVVVYVSNE